MNRRMPASRVAYGHTFAATVGRRGRARRARSMLRAGSVGLFGIVLAAHGSANERARGVDLDLVRGQGADACVAAEALEAEVTKRLGRDPFTRPVRQRIECLVSREGNAFVVRLYERDPDGKRLGDRVLSVATEDCRELDDALALAVVLLIDPEYKPAVVSPPPAVPRSANYDGGYGSTSASAPFVAHSAISPLPRATRVTLTAATGQVVPRSRPVGDSRVLLGFGGSVGLLPAVGPELILSVQRRWQGLFHGYVSTLYVPERQVPSVPTIALGLTALKLAVCLEGPQRVAAFVCGGVLGGVVHAVVYAPRPVDPGDRGWAAASVDGGARTAIGSFIFEMRGQVVAPLVHWNFNLSSGKRVFREPWVAPGFVLAVGTHFP